MRNDKYFKFVLPKMRVEISHHYGIDNFFEKGAAISHNK